MNDDKFDLNYINIIRPLKAGDTLPGNSNKIINNYFIAEDNEFSQNILNSGRLLEMNYLNEELILSPNAVNSPLSNFIDSIYYQDPQDELPPDDDPDDNGGQNGNIRQDLLMKKKKIMNDYQKELDNIDTKANLLNKDQGNNDFSKLIKTYSDKIDNWLKDSVGELNQEESSERDNYTDLANKNKSKLKSSVIGKIAADLAKVIGNKEFTYGTGIGDEIAIKDDENPSKPRDGFKNSHQKGQRLSESCEEHGGVKINRSDGGFDVACKPDGYQCPKFESPKILTGKQDKPGETIDKITADIYSCNFPKKSNCSLDCIRMLTLIWQIAGYGAFGKEYLNSFGENGIWIGPILNTPAEQKDVWPWGVDIENEKSLPKPGSIVFFNQTATMYIGGGEYLVPTAGKMQVMGKKEAMSECASQAGSTNPEKKCQYNPNGP